MLGVAQGGTGLATLTAHALYVGNGTSAPTALAIGATDKPLVGATGANPAFSKLTLTNPATSATITIADGKTFTVNNIMTLAGTDSQTYTFPSTSATIARTDAANTFIGVQTMTSPVLTTPVITTDLHAATAGGATVGSALLPFSGVFIGSAATNNIELTGTSAAGRIVTIPDIGTNTGATVVLSPTSTTVTQVLHATATAGLYSPAAIVAADLPVVPIITPSATPTLVGPKAIAICTNTCTVSVPVPVAGYEFCVYNDDAVTTAITLSALGSGAMYENSARTAYGTPATGTLVVAAAAADMVCIVGRDSTHYLTTRYSGVITVN
jgi:hypothetical protein